MADFSDSFTGANGSAWSGWTSTPRGGSITTQSNAGRMVTGTTAWSYTFAARSSVTDGDLLLSVTPQSTSAEHYINIFVRSSSNTTINNGYSFQLSPQSGTLLFSRWDNGTETEMDSATFSFTAGTQYRVRFRWLGSSLRAKIWAASSSEPAGWTVESTDTTYGAAGYLALSVMTATGARTVDFDNLAVTDLTANPGPSGPTLYEPFTGPNGSAPNGTSTPGAGVVDIQSNKLRIVSATTTGATSRWANTGVTDAELTVEVTPTSTDPTTIDILARSSSATSFANGYGVRLIVNTSTIELGKWSSGTFTPAASGSLSFVAGVAYRVKFRFEGTSLKARIWQTSSAEPGAWHLEAADSSVTAAGFVQLAVTTGASPAVRTVLFDDLLIAPIQAQTPVPVSAGNYLAGGNGARADIPAPSGVANSDIVVVDLYKENSATVTAPSGFQQIGTAVAAGSRQWHYQYWKRSTGNEPTSYAFTWSGTTWRSGVAVSYRGAVSTGNPVEAFDTAGNANNSTSSPTVSLTTSGPNRRVVWSASNWNGGKWTPPSGFTELVDAGDAVTIATREQALAGATGSVSGAAGENNSITARIFALVPTSAPAAAPPLVSTGLSITVELGQTVTRTASESDGGAIISSRSWKIQSGPAGVGTTVGTTATLTWTPTLVGTYVVRYTATNSAGSNYDDLTVVVEAPPPPPPLDEPAESFWLGEAWYLGPKGRIRQLPCPDKNVQARPVRYGGVHQGLSGARVQDFTGVKAEYQLSLPLLSQEEHAWIDALQTNHVRGPYFLMDPAKGNRLSTRATHLYVGWVAATGVKTQAQWSVSRDAPDAAVLAGHSLVFSGWNTTFNTVMFDGNRPTVCFTGEKVTGSVYLKASASHTATLRFRYYDIDGEVLGDSATVTMNVGTAWGRYSITKVTPVNAVGQVLLLTFGTVGPTVKVSAPQINAGASATAFETGGGAPQVIIGQYDCQYPHFPIRDASLTLWEA